MTKDKKRKLIYKILEKEIEDTGLNVTPYCFGSIKYYNSKYFKNSIKKSLKFHDSSEFISTLLKPAYIRGAYNVEDKEIIIFFDNLPIYDNIIHTLQTVFHELFHALDEENKVTNLDQYTNFSNECDKWLIDTAPFSDLITYIVSPKDHDAYMFEILANLYGIQKTEKYIKENNIKCSNFELSRLKKLKAKYTLQYERHDLTKSLNLIIKDYQYFIKFEDFDKTIFEYFFTDNGEVKDINTIFLNEKVLELDNRILSAFIKTDKIKEAIKNSNINEKIGIILEKILNNKDYYTNDKNNFMLK